MKKADIKTYSVRNVLTDRKFDSAPSSTDGQGGEGLKCNTYTKPRFPI